MEKVLNRILEDKIIGIVRADSTDYSSIKNTVRSMIEGGNEVIEITLNTPSSLKYIAQIKEDFPQALIGAGTVLDSESARLAITVGADFLLTPTLNKEVIELANRYSVLTIPGVLTPTEAITASEYGARLIKIFPASNLGPSYIKDLLGPLNHLKLMPVGGVNLDNAREFLEAGSSVIGLGSSLVDNILIRSENFDEIKKRSESFRALINQYKQSR